MDTIQAIVHLAELHEYQVGVYIRGHGQFRQEYKDTVRDMRSKFIDSLRALGITDEQMMAAGVIYP